MKLFACAPWFFSVILGFVALGAFTQAHWTPQNSTTTARFRGLCAVSPQIVWACGNHGTVARTIDGGRTWARIKGDPPKGYRSCVAYVPGTKTPALVAVGLSGSDISVDDGQTWENFDVAGYHSVRFSGQASGWALGEGGRIARYTESTTGSSEL